MYSVAISLTILRAKKKQELAGLRGSNCSRKYNKHPVPLATAGPRDEKSTVTLTVELAGNRPLEENRRTKSAEFSLGTSIRIRGSHRGTDQTGWLAEGSEKNSQNGHYVRWDEKMGESTLRTDFWVCALSQLYYIPITK